MKKLLPALLFSALTAFPIYAQEWSVGVRTGAFVFGDFVERRLRAGNEEPGEVHLVVLSAATRPGLAVDLERALSDRWAVRAQGTFTRSPLSIQGDDDNDDGFELDAGELDVATFAVPIVFRINTGGSFRFHLMAGPAYAAYRIEAPENAPNTVPVFEGTRSAWGAMAGAGVAWMLSDRFAVEGAISDVVTSSPFDREDFADVPGIDILRPHNVHTTVGLRWRF